MSVDGTDMAIQEHDPFRTGWYSQKINGPAVRYKAGVSCGTGDTIWFKGPLHALVNPDNSIFRSARKIVCCRTKL